ncbi:MAG TPA: GDP-L-fucose synthase [Burkholderiales bacterium]|nr:GDP-L-fucose synthase [Burkholderiales bacterium]
MSAAPMSAHVSAQSRVFVAGHRGMVGSALLRRLSADGADVIARTRTELDLTDAPAVHAFFEREKPEYVFMAAGKVGGISANDTYPGDFIYQNLSIEVNVLEAARHNGVRRMLFLGSSCVYPRDCPQPIREEYLLTGPLERTNRAYAVAKIAGIEMCGSYNRQFGTRFLAVMPTNLYGPNDHYDLQNSHVLPALIRKFHEAKQRSEPSVTAWGTGSPRREFLYSDELADACVFLMRLDDARFDALLQHDQPLVNIGCGEDLTIRELTELVKSVVGFEGEIVWDSSKPDGTPRKMLDVSRLTALGWRAKLPLRDGIVLAYRDFLQGEHAR